MNTNHFQSSTQDFFSFSFFPSKSCALVSRVIGWENWTWFRGLVGGGGELVPFTLIFMTFGYMFMLMFMVTCWGGLWYWGCWWRYGLCWVCGFFWFMASWSKVVKFVGVDSFCFSSFHTDSKSMWLLFAPIPEKLLNWFLSKVLGEILVSSIRSKLGFGASFV